MYKVICKNGECINKDVIYYFVETTELTICGTCKNEITLTKMTKTEYDKVFDYDPYKQPEFLINEI
jgi:hypothetical protein